MTIPVESYYLPAFRHSYRQTGSWRPPAAPLSNNAPKASSHLPPESAYFLAVNRNKRSITVNFKKPRGLEILHKLVAKADVLVENFLPGKLDTIGLGYSDCSAINDRLIYTSITGTFTPYASPSSVDIGSLGYGQTGPYRTSAGYDVVIEGEAGLMHMLVECQ